jgi:hypothetical protein
MHDILQRLDTTFHDTTVMSWVSLQPFPVACIETDHKFGCYYCRDVGLPRLTQRQASADRISGHELMFQGCGGKPALQRCETGQAHVSTMLREIIS